LEVGKNIYAAQKWAAKKLLPLASQD